MSRLAKQLSVGSLFATILFSVPSEAATYVATYTGTVTQGRDFNAVLGGNVVIDNLPFIATYTFNLDRGAPIKQNSAFTASDPEFEKIVFTIGGVSFSFNSEVYGNAYRYDSSIASGDDIVGNQVNSADHRQVYNQVATQTDLFAFQNFSTNINYAVLASDSAIGGFDLGNGLSGSLRDTSVVVSLAPALPEPATWAMMLLGFGSLGYILRRRQATTRIHFA